MVEYIIYAHPSVSILRYSRGRGWGAGVGVGVAALRIGGTAPADPIAVPPPAVPRWVWGVGECAWMRPWEGPVSGWRSHLGVQA